MLGFDNIWYVRKQVCMSVTSERRIIILAKCGFTTQLQNTFLLLLLLLLSLPSSYADDEVSTSLLHLLRSLARTVAVVKSSLDSSKSSLTLSIHFFLCRPLLLFPRM